jgi:hypothetical protein
MRGRGDVDWKLGVLFAAWQVLLTALVVVIVGCCR